MEDAKNLGSLRSKGLLLGGIPTKRSMRWASWFFEGSAASTRAVIDGRPGRENGPADASGVACLAGQN